MSSPAPGERCEVADDLSPSSPSTRSAFTPSASCVNSASAQTTTPAPRDRNSKGTNARQIRRRLLGQAQGKAKCHAHGRAAQQRASAAKQRATRHRAQRTVMGSVGGVEIHVVVDAGNPTLEVGISIQAGRRPTQEPCILPAAQGVRPRPHLVATPCRMLHTRPVLS